MTLKHLNRHCLIHLRIRLLNRGKFKQAEKVWEVIESREKKGRV